MSAMRASDRRWYGRNLQEANRSHPWLVSGYPGESVAYSTLEEARQAAENLEGAAVISHWHRTAWWRSEQWHHYKLAGKNSAPRKAEGG